MTEVQDLSAFKRIVFFTGAGLSAESGIDTYRGAGGVWTKYDYREYACQSAFNRDPSKVWEFHDARREDIAGRQPNGAHLAIAGVERQKPDTVVVTQNIDGLHQAAGSDNIIELHGSLWRVRCENCGKAREDFCIPLSPKHCECGSWWRPDIIWFEDALNATSINRAVQAIEACDCLVAIGTSASVYPAAELPFIAIERGAWTIEVNPEQTPLSAYYRQTMRGAATEMMKVLHPSED